MSFVPLPRLVFPTHVFPTPAPPFWPRRRWRLCSTPRGLSLRVLRGLGPSFEHPAKDPFLDPLLEAAVAGLVGRVAFGQVLPRRPGAQYPEDAV
jgi:hypothetical protein